MNLDSITPDQEPSGNPLLNFLDKTAAVSLVLVCASLVWMLAAAYQPDGLRLATEELEVWIVVGLLVAALVLVSVVSLMHTR